MRTDDKWCQTIATLIYVPFGSGELKRQLRMQGAPNPSIVLCLKQFRSYQKDLACIQNVNKTALAIFYFSSFDINWKL